MSRRDSGPSRSERPTSSSRRSTCAKRWRVIGRLPAKARSAHEAARVDDRVVVAARPNGRALRVLNDVDGGADIGDVEHSLHDAPWVRQRHDAAVQLCCASERECEAHTLGAAVAKLREVEGQRLAALGERP